jgi:hypothetical protein
MMTFMRSLLFFLLLATPALAQNDSTVVADTTKAAVDSVLVEDEYDLEEAVENPRDTIMVAAPDDRSTQATRYPTDDQLNRYRQDRDYQYGDDVPPPDSLIGKFFDWLFRKIGQFFSSPSYQSFWRYVIIAAVAGLVIYLAYKAEFLGIVPPANRGRSTLDYETLKEDIHAIDFNKELETATAQGNYRLAVRLLYLKTLKQLTDQKLIDWKPDKTNSQYAYELANQPFAPQFNALTHDFDYVWYGNFSIEKSQFEELSGEFSRLSDLFKGIEKGYGEHRKTH